MVLMSLALATGTNVAVSVSPTVAALAPTCTATCVSGLDSSSLSKRLRLYIISNTFTIGTGGRSLDV